MVNLKNIFRKKYSTGLISRDFPDVRDYLLSEIQPVGVALPDSFDLRSQQSPVENQFQFGVCYAMSGTGYQEFWNTKEYGNLIDLSERFAVWGTKKISGMWGMQADYLINILKAICDFGTPLEKDYPNDFSLSWEKFIEEPPAEIKQKALEFRGKTYWRVNNDLESMRQAIFQNKCPLFIGMPWYSSYNSPTSEGRLPLPSGNKAGHAVLCVGWENDKLWFKNSWGVGWSRQGYFYIPFSDFLKYEIWDARILLDLEKPQIINEGWVANNYLKIDEFIIGNKVSPTVRLNLRDAPNGTKILTLEKGTKLTIISEPIKNGDYQWIRVKII